MISVFVSSTFRDMQGERDIIQKEVLPEIRSLCMERGENIGFIDLRWGVDTSRIADDEEKSKKVLNVCLDQIDRCKPYIIVLLGQRYGWVPDYSLIRNAVFSKPYTDDGNEKSVTALEIEYGALAKRDNADKYLFFFREDLPLETMPEEYRKDFGTESPFHADQLQKLKEKIKAAFPDRVFSYSLKWEGTRLSGYREFGSLVTEKLRTVISRSLREEAALTQGEKGLRDHLRLMEERRFGFSERNKLIRTIIGRVPDSRLILLPGEAGTGKTSLAAEIAGQLASENYRVIPIFCGHTSGSSSAYDVLELTVKVLEDLCAVTAPQEDLEFGQLKLYWTDLIDRFCAGGNRLAVIFDGIDRLAADDISIHLNFLPPRLHENCTVIITCRDSYPLPEHYPYRTFLQRIPNTEMGEAIGIIGRFMNRNAKELDAKSRLVLTTEKKSCLNPLFLSLMLRRIVNMDSDDFRGIAERGNDMSAISGYIADLIRESPDSIEGVTASLCREVKKYIAPDQTSLVLDLVALSSRGMSGEHLRAIFERNGWEWNELDFARLQKYLYGFVTERERGHFDYAYSEIRETVLAGMDRQRRQWLSTLLLNFAGTLPDHDYLKLSDLFRLACETDQKKPVVDLLNHMGETDNSQAARFLARNMGVCIANGNDEWFNTLLSEGCSFGAAYPMIDFIARYLIPDMRTFNASDAAMMNIGYLIAENTVRLGRRIREEARKAGESFGQVMRVTAENMESRFRDLGRAVSNYDSIGFALGRALAAAAVYCELVYDYDTALRYSCEALGYYQALHNIYANEPSLCSFSGLLTGTGNLSLRYGVYTMAVRLAESASDLCLGAKEKTDKVSECSFDALVLKGKACRMAGNTENALRCFREAVRECRPLAERTARPDLLTKLSEAYREYSMALLSAGDCAGAGAALEESRSIISSLSASQDYYERIRMNAFTFLQKGAVSCAAGNAPDAESEIGKSIMWFREIVSRYDTPDNQYHLAKSYIALARVKTTAGDYDSAQGCYESAGEILEALTEEYPNAGEPLEDLMHVYSEMGDCLAGQGLQSDASPYYEECASVRSRLRTLVMSSEEKINTFLRAGGYSL